MTWAYSMRTSVRQGETLAFAVGGVPASGTVRLQDAVDPEAARAELLAVVHRSLEPAQISVWISQHE